MNVDLFRNYLKNYRHFKAERMQKKELLELRWHELSGLKGVDPGKIPLTGGNKEYQELIKLDKYGEIEELIEDIDRLDKNIGYIERLLDRLDEETRKICVDLYVKNRTYDSVAVRNNMSVGQLQYLIRRKVGEL